jgi:hypothetical protein
MAKQYSLVRLSSPLHPAYKPFNTFSGVMGADVQKLLPILFSAEEFFFGKVRE